jgi:diguanylate cyclase (GGDEF)-like protein
VIAADGTVLLGPETLQGRRLDPATLSGDLVAESRTSRTGDYPGLGWRIVLTQPEAVAMQGYRDLQRRTVACALLLCAVLVPVLWLLARRLSSPLQQLARRLDGQPAASDHAPLYREADLLRQALDRYETRHREDSDRLRDLNAELEARVAQRTAELARSNEELRDAERQMAEIARTDVLTGLPNRYSFDERLALALARSRRSGQPLALCFLDVDKFKAINDTLGHAAGDEVLRQFARRLTKCVRETDTVARLAGDEFVVVLEGLHTGAEPHLVARKIVSMMRRPMQVEGRSLAITTSVGVAFEADANIAPADLLARADAALYEAKAQGRNTFHVDAGSARDPAGATASTAACPL